jgi:putative alpha-1,2-mannosidase
MTRSNDPRTSAPDDAEALEQQMADLDLSAADKRFLRTLHQTEKQLNDAFDEAHQSGDLQQQVSRVYKQLYRPD